MRRLAAIFTVLLILSTSAKAYVDLAPTLAKLLRESPQVCVVEVEKVSRENNAVILRKVRDLKSPPAPASRPLAASQPATSQSASQPDPEFIRHQVAAPGTAMSQAILEWAEPGRRGVAFVTPLTTLVCMGQGWYQVTTPTLGWWKPGAARPELPLAYYGSVSRLVRAIEEMQAGKDAVITTLAHGADEIGASFDIALNRTSLPGLIKIQRTRANPRMPGWVISVQAKPNYLIGPGPVGEEDVPEVLRRLSSADPTERAEAADDLRWLGANRAILKSSTDWNAIVAALEKLLADQNVQVRTCAAGALLAINDASAAAPGAGKQRAIEVLTQAMASGDAVQRRQGARVCGLAGKAAAPLVGRLAKMLEDQDELARFAALQAIATLGPDAAEAREAVDKLLDDPALAINAADALGRMGPAAQASMKHLAKLIASDQKAMQWAGVRAMAQIGGADSEPAVVYMIEQLKSFSEVDGYNMMVYLCMLGPDAKAANSAVEQVRVKNRALRLAALWSFDPDKRFPWMESDRVMSFFRDADWQRYIFDALYQETGDRFRPAAKNLAQKIVDGSGGEIPSWGYKLLAHFADDAVPVLRQGLSSDQMIVRERAAVALGFMGPAARSAEADVKRAIEKAENEREQRLAKWCLKQVARKG